MATRVPKKMPNNWVLSQIAFPPPKENYFPSVSSKGLSQKPKISLEKQKEIRIACQLAGIDPELINLPPMFEQQVPTTPLGDKSVLERIKRQQNIHDKMKQMDQKVAEYRKERRRNKQEKKEF